VRGGALLAIAWARYFLAEKAVDCLTLAKYGRLERVQFRFKAARLAHPSVAREHALAQAELQPASPPAAAALPLKALFLPRVVKKASVTHRHGMTRQDKISRFTTIKYMTAACAVRDTRRF
jgi:hypothetical protein